MNNKSSPIYNLHYKLHILHFRFMYAVWKFCQFTKVKFFFENSDRPR